jgi:hypothetical protein
MTSNEIVINIDQRLANVRAEIAQLEGARAALIDGVGSAPKSTQRQAPRKTRRRPAGPRITEIVPAGKVTALLVRSGGMSTTELADAAKGNRDQVFALLRELEQADQIYRTGQRRGTRWHLITDENPIAARASRTQSQRRPKQAA